MCCGAPKYASRRSAKDGTNSPASKKAAEEDKPVRSKPVIGRQITTKKLPMGPQKVLPKYVLPSRNFK